MLKWTNNAAGTLATAISAIDTALAVSPGQGARFPITNAEDWFHVTLRDSANNLEIIYVHSRTGDAFNPVLRGQDGTVALAFPAGAAVELRWANVSIRAAQDDVLIGLPAGGVNTYAVGLRVPPKAYNLGQLFPVFFSPANQSTSPLATLNVSGLGAKPIVRRGNMALAQGDLLGLCYLYYDGVSMILTNPAGGMDFPGSIVMTAAAAAPLGWVMLTAGGVLVRSIDVALFAAIGTTFGVGDGSTTFGLPEINGRAPVGVGPSGQGNVYGLGTKFGQDVVTLTEAQMPLHNHPLSDFTHTHNVNDPPHNHLAPVHTTGGGGNFTEIGEGTLGPTSSTPSGVTVLASGSNIQIAPTGGSQAHSIVQPVLGLNFMIKR